MTSSEKTVRRAPRAAAQPARSHNLLQVSGEIPDGGIDLRQRDLHIFSLSLGRRRTSDCRASLAV